MAADQEEVIKQLKIIAERVKPTSADMFGSKTIGGDDDNSAVVKAIQDSTKDKVLAKENKKLFDSMKKELNIKKEIKALGDVLKEQNQAKALYNLSVKIEKASKKEYASQEELNKDLKEFEQIAAKAGTTLKELDITGFKSLRNSTQKQIYVIKDGLNKGKKLNKQATEKIKVTARIIKQSNDLSDAYDKNLVRLEKFGNTVKDLGKQFLKFAEDEQRYAQATATADAGWIDGMTKMRISQLDYMKILKDTRIEGLAAQTAGVDFKASLAESTAGLRRLTANNVDAAKGAAQFHKNMASIGVSQGNLGDAVKQQTEIYEKNYRGMGYTVEEFANLTNELINDQGMRSVLLGLQEDERKSYVLNTQRRMAEYQAIGFTIERAKELEKSFQALNKMNPKERMKKAAKERAMLGALGMGDDGARLFKLQTSFRTMNEEEKGNAQTEMAAIRAKASKRFGAMSGSGVSQGQAASMQMLAEATGFNDIVDTFETESSKGRKISDKLQSKTNEIDSKIQKILEVMSTWEALQNSAVGSVITGLGGLLVGGLMAKLLPKLLGKGAGLMTKAGGAATELGAKAATTASGVKGVTSAAASVAGTAVKKGLTTAAAKAALKAIPGIGLIASLGFMVSRIADGDYIGAGMELASGAMGMIPGVGTAGSLAMTGAIVARDVSMDSSAVNKTEQVLAANTTQEATSTKEANPLVNLNTTLGSIDSYIRSMGDTNIELASSMRALGISMDDMARIRNLSSNRPT